MKANIFAPKVKHLCFFFKNGKEGQKNQKVSTSYLAYFEADGGENLTPFLKICNLNRGADRTVLNRAQNSNHQKGKLVVTFYRVGGWQEISKVSAQANSQTRLLRGLKFLLLVRQLFCPPYFDHLWAYKRRENSSKIGLNFSELCPSIYFQRFYPRSEKSVFF